MKMGVLHDYECPDHGIFEARAPRKCPFKGCKQEITRVFLKAPGYKSERTKGADSTLKKLAMDYGMTNIKSAREGESQAGVYKHGSPQQQVSAPPPKEPRPGDAAIWGGGFRGMNLQSVLAGRAVQSIHGEPVGFKPADAGNLTGPKASSYVADHENLQIKK
jgi:hypothetical protein